MAETETKFLEIEGARIAWEERGKGFPLLAVHGFFPDRRLMTGCLEGLFDDEGKANLPPSAVAARDEGGKTASSFRRIYLDLPFMGESSDPVSIRDSDGMLDALLAFVDAILPEGPFLLAGESYGAYLARGLAARRPDRVAGLLLICPLVVAPAGDRLLPLAGAARTEPGYGAGRDAADIEEFESVAAVRDRYCLERCLAEVIPGVRAARAVRLEAIRATGYRFSFDRMGRAGEADGSFDPVLARPALFLLGREDMSVGWRDALRLAESYPKASYAILSGAGHNLQIEAAGLFTALAGEWLARCELDQVFGSSPSGSGDL